MTSLDSNKKVWAPESVNGFILGRVVDILSDSVIVDPISTPGKTISAPYDCVYPAEENEKKDVDDNCALMFLNEATLLNNVRLRYNRDQIYTYVANILIALNPYIDIPGLYSAECIKKYQGKSIGVLPPHVFAIADKAYRDMKRSKESQSIIVSGESGAGKTESQKYILRYLCESWGSHAGPIEQRILETNPILEAFGNAKTMRNNNSSRFGKFVEIHFNKKHMVTGGYVSHYLLEKSRVVGQQWEERNYHIFYQLCAGGFPQLREQLFLLTPDHFNYLRKGCTQYFASPETEKHLTPRQLSQMHQKRGALRDPVIDDIADFHRLDSALANVGLNEKQRFQVYATVAAVLHLGNVEFMEIPQDTRGGCVVNPKCQSSLATAAGLLGVERGELEVGLTSRVMQANKGGGTDTIIRVPLKIYEAQNARDALAKAIYSRLFDFIVKTINDCIPYDSSEFYIGVLDIAGFEYFTINSFEQFCINYCNEKLQQFFNERILKQEQELYEKEGLGVKKISYVDNADCIELIEGKNYGILDMLDEESKLPKPSPQHFTSTLHQTHKTHYRLAVPRKSKLKEHRDIRDDEGFLVRHFAGAVCYYTANFIDKNNDALHASLELIIQESKLPLLRYLFQDGSAEENGAYNNTNNNNNNDVRTSSWQDSRVPSKSKQGKLGFVSVGSKFRSQLKVLVDKLENTGTHFVRCIKPNSKMVARCFDGGPILSQLQCSGMPSVLALMQQGYPSRTQFAELYKMYKDFLPPDLSRLDPRLFCKCLFKALGLNDHDYKFGLTKVFFRPGKFSEFDQLLRSDPENLKRLVSKVRVWLIKMRWKKAQWCALSVIKLKNKILWRQAQLVMIQSWIRRFLVLKKHKAKIEGVRKLRGLKQLLTEMRTTLDSLKKDKEKWQNEIAQLEMSMNQLIVKIRDTPMQQPAIERECAQLTSAVQEKLNNLRSQVQLQAVEQERLKKLQQQMEEEKRRKELEEEKQRKLEQEKQRQMEEDRKIKAEMEKKQKQLEEIANKEKEKNSQIYEKQIVKQAEEEQRRTMLRQQEIRDRQIALQLAVEINGTVDETASNVPQNVKPAVSSGPAIKYDLSTWKFPELRDAINTSNDIELLQACRTEFHRRLRVYNQWKERSQKNVNQRAPDFVFDNAQYQELMQQVEAKQNGQQKIAIQNGALPAPPPQRFFRVPFTRNTDQYREGNETKKTGWWYAHFDGQYIARQMELHPDKTPVLLIAGRDDMQMCELSLEESGLARKRGAEIVSHEFESEWNKNGGPMYVRQKPYPNSNSNPNIVTPTRQQQQQQQSNTVRRAAVRS